MSRVEIHTVNPWNDCMHPIHAFEGLYLHNLLPQSPGHLNNYNSREFRYGGARFNQVQKRHKRDKRTECYVAIRVCFACTTTLIVRSVNHSFVTCSSQDASKDEPTKPRRTVMSLTPTTITISLILDFTHALRSSLFSSIWGSRNGKVWMQGSESL